MKQETKTTIKTTILVVIAIACSANAVFLQLINKNFTLQFRGYMTIFGIIVGFTILLTGLFFMNQKEAEEEKKQQESSTQQMP